MGNESYEEFAKNMDSNREILLNFECIKEAIDRLNMYEKEFRTMPIDELLRILLQNVKEYSVRICKFIQSQKNNILSFLSLSGEDAYFISFFSGLSTVCIAFDNGIKNKKLKNGLMPYLTETSDNTFLLPLTPILQESEVHRVIDIIMGSN